MISSPLALIKGRHGRACPGHPRDAVTIKFRRFGSPPGADARHKAGHDARGLFALEKAGQ
jgi:hypothetical protein